MTITPFIRLEAVAAPMARDNIDTDALFPAHFIKRMDVDYGATLFANWRFTDGIATERPDFVLNRPAYRDTRILVAGENFGCGSSREHAVWALKAFGIRCVIAKSFGDIFHGNCFKNGLLPVALPTEEVDRLLTDLETAAEKSLIVDLETEKIIVPGDREIPFATDQGRRRQLLEGLDDIGMTLLHAAGIGRFQDSDKKQRPWVYQPGGTKN